MEKTTNPTWIRGESIGKGSFGTVNLAFDRQTGRVFAVKSVAVNPSTKAQMEAIENEISILKSISSPFIVNYFSSDFTAENSKLFRNLHMEYLAGGTASEISKSKNDEESVRKSIKRVVLALQHIHSKGIIHCDVKGRNILLGSHPDATKLADFGCAKREEDRTVKMVARGSPLWMAPEVVRRESQGRESDVWALGCTVIEMMSGLPAWRDEGWCTMKKIGYSDEVPEFPDRLSELGRDFVGKCLRRDLKERWSCDQLLMHPFLGVQSTVEIADWSSPRSVIGWPRLEEERDESVGCCSSGGARIGQLAGLEGANWESDGWIQLRGEEVGTTSGFSETLGVKQEFQSSGEGSTSTVEDNRKASFSTVNAKLMYSSPSILYYVNHLCYYHNIHTLHTSIFFMGRDSGANRSFNTKYECLLA